MVVKGVEPVAKSKPGKEMNATAGYVNASWFRFGFFH